MSFVDVANGELILVQIGDGESPEVFAHDCLINSERGISLSASTVTNEVARCDDPSAPSKTTRAVQATDSSISGAGKMHSSSVKEFMDWLLSGRPKNIRVKHNAVGKWQVAGSYLLTAFQVTGAVKTNAEVTLTLEQADQIATSVVS